MGLNPLRVLFFEEARENLDAMEQGLLHLESGKDGKEQLDAVFRRAHSIKGGAAAFGMADISELTHVMESLLDRLRLRGAVPEDDTVGLLLESVDAVRALLARHQSGAAEAVDRRGLLVQRLQSAALDRRQPAPTRLMEMHVGSVDHPAGAEAVVQLFRDIPSLGELTPLQPGPGGAAAFLVRTSSSQEDLVDLLAFHVAKDQVSIRAADAALLDTPERSGAAATSQSPVGLVSSPSDDASTIRVAVSKVAGLVDISAELVAAQAAVVRASQMLDEAAQAHLFADMAVLRARIQDLQRAVVAIRMMPMALAFSRFPRMLRDLSVKLGKKFTLVTLGESIELDKAWVEKIADPLTHLVRNSCDHGIENPVERREAGKPEVGTITLSVRAEAGAVVISVQDDGRGLERERMLQSARARGIAVSEEMSDEEVWKLALLPGFSTATVVTDVSGRGVGMDVVRRNVAMLGGSVDIASVPGQGTCVSMRLHPPQES